MYCENCGTSVNAGSKFCSACGSKTEAGESPPRASQSNFTGASRRNASYKVQTILLVSIPVLLLGIVMAWLIIPSTFQSTTIQMRQPEEQAAPKLNPRVLAPEPPSAKADRLGYPSGMPPLSKFVVKVSGVNVCGFHEKLTTYTIEVDPYEAKSEVWTAGYKENATYPYLLMRSFINHSLPVRADIWVYKSSAGPAAEEYIDKDAEFFRKYPNACEAALPQTTPNDRKLPSVIEDARSQVALEKVASELNRSVPTMIDNETQLIEVSALAGILVYNYKLINYTVAPVDRNKFAAGAKQRVTQGACNTPDTRDDFLKKGVTVRYSYYDKNKQPIATIDVKPSDCGF